jgi:hypothetical protein
MRTTPFVPLALACAALLGAAPAQAQYTPQTPANPAVGERYHVELSADLWSPEPIMTASSESLGIEGTTFDLEKDFGVTKKRLNRFQLILRPAKKHKFRFDYTPIHYTADATLSRDIVFNGIRYHVGVPVSLDLMWRAWRLGYEYDFIYRDRGFVGAIFEAKYTDVQVNLSSSVINANEFARARAPVPSVGGIARVYVASNASVTFEMTGFKLPQSIKEGWKAKYIELDLYGTANFTNNVGARFGYRKINLDYTFDQDFGDFQLGGLYFGGVVRF